VDFKELIEYSTAAFSFVGFVITLMIKLAQAKVKEDLSKQISQTDRTLAVHCAQDELKFDNICEKLDTIHEVVKRKT
jgi:hypothetical protein